MSLPWLSWRIDTAMIPGNPFKRFWQFLRQVTGDDAYERYRAHHAKVHPQGSHCSEVLLSRQQFFKLRQDEKWSRVSRCC